MVLKQAKVKVKKIEKLLDTQNKNNTMKICDMFEDYRIPYHLKSRLIKLNQLTSNKMFKSIGEIVNFIKFCKENNLINKKNSIERNFNECSDIDMNNIKLYYLKILKNISDTEWSKIVDYNSNRKKKIVTNQYVDTKGEYSWKPASKS